MTQEPESYAHVGPSNRARLLRPSVIIASIAGFIVLGGVLLLWLPQILIDNWLQNQPADSAVMRQAVGNSAQVVLFALGGLIALVGVGLSLSRHQLELEDSRLARTKEQRRVAELRQQARVDAERELRGRFTQAVSLLSDQDRPTTRQAGVYALGALADDWTNHGRSDERQVCIDVLCGYLRSSWDPNAPDADGERRIRATAFNLIAAHLRRGSGVPSWDGVSINVRGALLDFDIDFRSVTVAASRLDFSDIDLVGGSVEFDGASVLGGTITFDGARLAGGTLQFADAAFRGGNVRFVGAAFAGADVRFGNASFRRGVVSFDLAEFSAGSVRFVDAAFTGGTVRFVGATFSGGSVPFARSNFARGEVWFDQVTFSGGSVAFVGATFAGTQLWFVGASFLGGDVWFDDVYFRGGSVHIDGRRFTRHPVLVPEDRMTVRRPEGRRWGLAPLPNEQRSSFIV